MLRVFRVFRVLCSVFLFFFDCGRIEAKAFDLFLIGQSVGLLTFEIGRVGGRVVGV